ncbi:DUF2306 domain-containing protein [Gottfriedia acidiceleris]|uniref:DUF2306 domain-containing protein n=1 Tax=Gottfriedia acidiceleris TaxID=371036 RepID=A0ABY4JN88_9BACI|nr:DUF2306 domain-containing protein [Gottfriedia acidiceleris]UPM55309.1 DUF2306 domain-containing protein [Gottfriedia acidiceleris]
MNSRKSWWILFIISLCVIVPFMAPYFLIDPEKSRIQISSTSIQYPALITHIFFAFIALIVGFLQFKKKVRSRNTRIHRMIGTIYYTSVFISGILSLIVIFYIENFSKVMSFLVLAILWIFTTIKGIHSAKKKNYIAHQIWMTRSFGITLVAVSGRVLVPFILLAYFLLNGLDIPGGRERMVEEALNVNIWVGLLINLIITEWIILKRKVD